MTAIDNIYADKCSEKSDINEHLPTLRDYASRCRHVTEFGVRGIVSTWALIAGRPSRVISYDITPLTDEAQCMVRAAAKEAGVEFRFIQGDTREVEIEPTELLFIDTSHTYTQLHCELERHGPRVKKFIILHDTVTFGDKGEQESDAGLRPAIKEFIEGHPWKRRAHFYYNNGLTILERL